MDGFERRKEESREKILNAAETLFVKHGINRVSVDDIAREAGVSKVTIYNLFGSKGNLVNEHRLTIANRVVGRFREILTWKKPYIQSIQDIAQYWIDISDKYAIESIDCPEFLDNLNLEGSHQAIKFQQELLNIFLDFISEGKKLGNLNADISDEAAGIFLRIFMEGIKASPEIDERVRHDSKLAHDLFQIMLYGFSPAPGKTKSK